MKRFYVSGASAAHLLGFVDIDERGVGGIELSYDKAIRGQPGRLLLDVDALNKSYDHSVENPVPGADVSLTIDLTISTMSRGRFATLFARRARVEVRSYAAAGDR